MKTLAGRRILFIGIGFYDYESSIVDRLLAAGAQVTAFQSPPAALSTGPLAGMLRRVNWLARRLDQRHEQAMLAAASGAGFDQVLIIKGMDPSLAFLRALRARLPAAEFVLYQWDSLARLPGIEERLPLFDRVLTFDRQDAAARGGLAFRPLFFRESAAPQDTAARGADIDISFVGWLHSDRLKAVRDIEAAARAQGLSTYVYLYTGLVTWLRLALRAQARGVHFRPLPYRSVMAICRRSRCVLDLPHAAQAGLTMRAIEALGFGNKLATTGTDIRHYDFFAPSNVAVLDARAPRIDPAFVSGQPTPIPEAVWRRYTLDAWIADVLGVT